MSLQARITLSVAGAVAAILAAFGYSATWAIRESTSTVLDERVQIAKVLAGQVATALDGDRDALEDLAQTLSPYSALERQERVLQQAAASRRLAAVALTTPAGVPLWARPSGWLAHGVASPVLRLAPSGAAARPALTTLPGSHLAAFVLPLRGSNHLLIGAVDLAQTGPADALHAHDGAPLNAEIIDAHGVVLASSEQRAVGRPSEHLPVIAALAGQGRAGVVFHGLPGYPHYIAHAPLPGYPGWAIDVEQPRDLVLSLLYGRRVVRPLARLRQAAEQIAGGDLDRPVQMDRRDEVGALARTFEAMRTALRASREEIAAWNQELEDRVAKRTRALRAMAEENARLFAVARREERNLTSTVDLLSDGLLTLTLDRRILSLNPAAEGLLGWTSAEARGLMCGELLACPGCAQGHPGSSCLLEAALETGRAVRSIRLRARRRGGETFPVSLTAGLGRDETDQPTHFIITIRDMTTEEAYEQQLRERIRQLTALHEVAQALNLVPLRTVEETARDIVKRITAATGSHCRLDLEPRDLRPQEAPTASTGSPQGEDQRTHAGLVGEPLVLQGRQTGTLWLDPGPAGLAEGNPALVRIIASQVAVAIENAKLYEEVRDRDALRRQLLARIVVAQEEERRRIARELHDEIGQALTALVMQLGGVAGTLPPEAAALRDRLVAIREMTSHAVGEVRRLMLNLRPAVLDDLGLVPAIRWYAEAYLRPAGIEAQVSVAGLDERGRLPEHLELAAFRLTQEALTNVVRHARATRVTIALERKDGALALSINDDGCGFDVERRARPGQRGGWGLVGMHERAALLGGNMAVSSQPGHGTSVTVTLPVGEGGADGH